MARQVSDAIRKMQWEAQQKRNAELLAEHHATGNGIDPATLAQPRKPRVTVTAIEILGTMILTESEFREDLTELFRSIPGRAYRGDKHNSIPISEWKTFVVEANKLDNVVVQINKEIRDELEWHISAPTWLVSLGRSWFECKFGPHAAQTPMYSVPNAEYLREKKMWKVPLTEGWQLYEKLKEVQGVVYEAEAQEMIINQVEARARLDKIAKMTRGEKYLDFDFGNGHKLREFQEVGAEFAEAAQGRCIIADEMGLGKTWQSLAYAVKNGHRIFVICPASLKPNWARQIRTLSGERPTVLQGGEPSQHDLIKYITEPPKYSIINYDIVGRAMKFTKTHVDAQGFTHEDNQERYLWVELINMSKPDLVIIDEGHYIKNMDSNRSKAVRMIKCPRVMFLTGTPVLNRPGELWPMLTMIAPEQFPSNDTFLKQYTYDGKTAKNVEELRVLMRPIMIRRLKKDVQKDLPPVNRIVEDHELSEKALKLYRKIEAGIYISIDKYDAGGRGGTEMGIASILAQITRLKQVCAIDKIEHTAELARETYDQSDENSDRKVIIFSQFKAVAYHIQQLLGEDEALCFVHRTPTDYITADNAKRDEIVQKFQKETKWKYLVVTEKTTKEGHDITAAGNVIFNDPFWTPAGHDQAEGRAYGRLDNPHTINSFYMITAMGGESIEEWIMELLQSKMRMINEVVEGVEAGRGDVSVVMELIKKMKENMWTKGGKR